MIRLLFFGALFSIQYPALDIPLPSFHTEASMMTSFCEGMKKYACEYYSYSDSKIHRKFFHCMLHTPLLLPTANPKKACVGTCFGEAKAFTHYYQPFLPFLPFHPVILKENRRLT